MSFEFGIKAADLYKLCAPAACALDIETKHRTVDRQPGADVNDHIGSRKIFPRGRREIGPCQHAQVRNLAPAQVLG